MPLKKDYYKCIFVSENTKKNGDSYLFLRLENKDNIIDGYLWDNIHLYKNLIRATGIYAIKYQVDTFNSARVLNIKNLCPVDGARYSKYGFKKSMVTMKSSKKCQYYLNEISSIIKSRKDESLFYLNDFIIKNKSKFLSTKLIESKYLFLQYFELMEKTLKTSIDSNLYIYIIILHGLNLDISSLLNRIDTKDPIHEGLSLYANNNKGFIKKYKFIVDFIDDNQKNYINLKKESDKKDGKE